MLGLFGSYTSTVLSLHILRLNVSRRCYIPELDNVQAIGADPSDITIKAGEPFRPIPDDVTRACGLDSSPYGRKCPEEAECIDSGAPRSPNAVVRASDVVSPDAQAST